MKVSVTSGKDLALSVSLKKRELVIDLLVVRVEVKL